MDMIQLLEILEHLVLTQGIICVFVVHEVITGLLCWFFPPFDLTKDGHSVYRCMAVCRFCNYISAFFFLNQDIRQRHRYLCHLPLTCEFSICELALKPPIISKETLDLFSGWYLPF